MATEAKLRADYRDKAKNTIQIRLELRKTTESDIIGKLESVPNKSQYIKGLIREDIKNTKHDWDESTETIRIS